MAQQTIVATRACYVDNTISGATFTSTDTVAVYLTDSNNADGIPTVGRADDTNSVIYGKLDVNAKNWDVLNPSSVDSDGDVSYAGMASVIVDGVVTFAISAVGSGDIGSGIEGDASNTISAAATGSGKIVAYSNGTAWVDLRA